MPISAYRMLHTTGNSHAGGDSGGWFTVSLNVAAPSLDKKPDSAPIPTDSRIQNVYVFHVRFIVSPMERICPDSALHSSENCDKITISVR